MKPNNLVCVVYINNNLLVLQQTAKKSEYEKWLQEQNRLQGKEYKQPKGEYMNYKRLKQQLKKKKELEKQQRQYVSNFMYIYTYYLSGN